MTLNETIYNLEKTINCKLIYFNGLFTGTSLKHLKEIIINNKYCLPSNFLLILKSNGGDNVYGGSYSSIREILDEHLNGKNLWVLINKEVASTGTVISFSADKLFYLDESCKIGPIDPQDIEAGTTVIKDSITLELDWENNLLLTKDFKDPRVGITIEASMRSFQIGKIIDSNNLDRVFKYLMNVNNDFKNHSDRKEIHELPNYFKISMLDINNLVPKLQIEEIIKHLDTERYNYNYLLYSI